MLLTGYDSVVENQMFIEPIRFIGPDEFFFRIFRLNSLFVYYVLKFCSTNAFGDQPLEVLELACCRASLSTRSVICLGAGQKSFPPILCKLSSYCEVERIMFHTTLHILIVITVGFLRYTSSVHGLLPTSSIIFIVCINIYLTSKPIILININISLHVRSNNYSYKFK
jgi:hypothetical protein